MENSVIVQFNLNQKTLTCENVVQLSEGSTASLRKRQLAEFLADSLSKSIEGRENDFSDEFFDDVDFLIDTLYQDGLNFVKVISAQESPSDLTLICKCNQLRFDVTITEKQSLYGLMRNTIYY